MFLIHGIGRFHIQQFRLLTDYILYFIVKLPKRKVKITLCIEEYFVQYINKCTNVRSNTESFQTLMDVGNVRMYNYS